MRSRFPGMDPYLEGADWPDVHSSFAYVIKRQLVPQLTPKYFARIEKYVVTDKDPQLNLGIVYPDMEVWQKPPDMLQEPGTAHMTRPAFTPPTVTFPFLAEIELHIPIVELWDKDDNELITTIEILSPANKRNPGYNKFIEKQELLHKRGVNLIEIDLIRKGKRRVKHPLAQSSHYLVTLLRAGNIHLNVWAVDIKDKLPRIPVPLKAPDADVVLDLQRAFDELYEEGGYANSINYRKPPPPPAFSEEEQKWVDGILKNNTQ